VLASMYCSSAYPGPSYIKHRRTSLFLNTPSLETSWSAWLTAKRPNASRISASCSAVNPFSFASLDGRLVGGRALGGPRFLGGYSLS
jgi:hypothetical protein